MRAAGSPASEAGFQPGDRILAVGSEPVSDPYALQFALLSASGSVVPVEIVRGGEQVTVSLDVPNLDVDGDLLGQLGMGVSIKPRFDRVPLGSVIPVGVAQAWEQSGQMLSGIRDLVTGRAPLDQIAGPLGMGQITSEIVGASPSPLGHARAAGDPAVVEPGRPQPPPAPGTGRRQTIVRHRRGPPRREEVGAGTRGIVHVAGLILLLGFMVIVLVLDALRIYEGRSFLP